MNAGLTQPIGSLPEDENSNSSTIGEETNQVTDPFGGDTTPTSAPLDGQGELFSETLEELINIAPSGRKIAAKCDRVHEYAVNKFFPNNEETWSPVAVFGNYSTSDHLQNAVNANLSTIQQQSLSDDSSHDAHAVTLLDLSANLIALAVALQYSNVTLSGVQGKHLELKELLLRKNISYQNSALNPVSIFGNLDAKDQLHSRMNDKLNRIKNNTNYRTEGQEDAINDLIGYLILLLVYYDNATA